MSTNLTKETIVELLRRWIAQRPGLEYCNYGNPTAYRAELRGITNDLHDARTLLRAVELSSMTADELREGFRAFSGRLQLAENNGEWTLEYCTGQYWPTEYRAAACAVLASALWDYHRSDLVDQRDALALRAKFRRMFGKGIQARWFN